MTKLSDIVEIARVNFEHAQTNLDADLAVTRTPAEARAVLDNRDRALAAYMALLTASLDAFAGDWDALAGRARIAADDVASATAEAAAHADRLRLMAGVTSSLADIVKSLNI